MLPLVKVANLAMARVTPRRVRVRLRPQHGMYFEYNSHLKTNMVSPSRVPLNSSNTIKSMVSIRLDDDDNTEEVSSV